MRTRILAADMDENGKESTVGAGAHQQRMDNLVRGRTCQTSCGCDQPCKGRHRQGQLENRKNKTNQESTNQGGDQCRKSHHSASAQGDRKKLLQLIEMVAGSKRLSSGRADGVEILHKVLALIDTILGCVLYKGLKTAGINLEI